MRHAFADRKDPRVERLHDVVDDNTALDADPRCFGQRGVGPDADGHHHQIGGQGPAILESDGRHPARFTSQEFGGLLLERELQALVLKRLLQHARRRAVELALHQPRHYVHDRDIHAALFQAVGGLQPQQTASDHHRVPVAAGGLDHRIRVGDVAVADDAGQILSWHRQDEGI